MSQIPMPKGSDNGVTFGLGFGLVTDAAAMGQIGSDGSFYWGGAALTFYWIDPENDMVILAMTQHLAAPQAAEVLGRLRPLVYSSLIQ
jgi:CubicO group peptidase (beta-lactamase class C family)